MADPDASVQKRPRLDSGNPGYNGQFAPLPPPRTQPPALAQAISLPPSHHHPSHSLPPPSPSFPSQGQTPYPGVHLGVQPQPSSSLPPSDIRTLADPRTIPSPGQRAHGIAGHAPVTNPQDRASNYRRPSASQPTVASDPHISRSNSISHEPKSEHSRNNNTMDQHANPTSPWHMNPEQRPNGSAPNGYGHTISPTHGNGPLFHPPSQPSAQQYPQSGNLYTPGTYIDQYGAQGQIRRKQVRATQACNHCRSRKQKCDEARPCQFCRENNFDCQYKDVPPPKQDRSMMQLQDSVNNAVGLLKSFMKDMSEWRQSVDSRLPPVRGVEVISDHASPEAAFTAPMRDPSSSRWAAPAQGGNQARRFSNMKMESPIVSNSNMSPSGPQVSTPVKQELALAGLHQPATPAESIRTDRSRTSDSSPRDKSGLQSDHTTPAHKLLAEWQSMHTFYKDIDYLTKLVDSGHEVSDYAMQLEQDRGLIRVWGVGEGQDLNDGAQGPGSPESSTDSDVTSPAPWKDTLWGHPPLDRSSPSTASSETLRDSPAYDGGLGADGRPNFHSKVLEDLLKSYLDNMHNLHPFLNPSKLRRMVREFTEQYSPDIKAANARSPASSALQYQLHQGVKRKRSSSIFGEPSSPKGSIERSLRNAIVLLVFALGKVCSHGDTLPAPQSDKTPVSGGLWGFSRDSPHPTSNSFIGENTEENRPRNIDFLPGMAYFSFATDILGNQQGGNTVAHAQAMILAALYLSQFARVLESWSWIHNACRVTMVLVKADYPKLIRKFYSDKGPATLTSKERYRLNLVMCVFWTCLQLESDILAEMSTLPPSMISKHQNDIMYPEVVVEYDKFSADQPQDAPPPGTDLSMLAYSSQIWLRVVLNEAHNALYGANGRMSFDICNIKEVVNHATIHIDILESWRQVMPAALAWKDEELPSTDLNIARVRAKYYGGLYMMLRPYLLIAIQNLEFPPASYSSQYESPAYSGEYDATPASRNVQMVELSEDQRKIIQIACQCIDSAIQSTIAFDRVGALPGSSYTGYQPVRTKRLVLTNIFGTLHAQFGNMLVLVSVYKSKIYHLLPNDTPLTKANLTALLARTIAVLSEMAPNSPILKMDLEILYNVRRQNGLMP